jgi:succinyl-CoA synthetase alpha subunit
VAKNIRTYERPALSLPKHCRRVQTFFMVADCATIMVADCATIMILPGQIARLGNPSLDFGQPANVP